MDSIYERKKCGNLDIETPEKRNNNNNNNKYNDNYNHRRWLRGASLTRPLHTTATSLGTLDNNWSEIKRQ